MKPSEPLENQNSLPQALSLRSRGETLDRNPGQSELSKVRCWPQGVMRPIAAIGAAGAPARWVRLYAGLLAGPSHPKIELYQGESPPYGALCISRITRPTGPSIR